MRRVFLSCLISFLFVLPTNVLANEELYLGGDSIGIEVSYDGVMISGTYAISVEGEMYDPIKEGFQVGDRIVEVNGNKINNLKDLYKEVSKFQNAVNDIPITIINNQKKLHKNLKTIFHSENKSFQSGLYVKDKITGIGTITFYNPKNKSYGALGHEVLDSDLHQLAQIQEGSIYESDVKAITKAQPNIAGEKHAEIKYDKIVGSIEKNTEIGIYGHYHDLISHKQAIKWAKQDEIQLGKAYIYTVLDGNNIMKYEIEITKLNKQKQPAVKGIEFTITDTTLLQKTNGVIQGMSGSPIVQNDKIIGAITHVITGKPTTGYGVYIEWMLQQTNNL